MKTIIKSSLFILILITMNSCCNCRKGSPVIGNLEKSVWQLVELNNKQIDNSGISIRFDANEKMIYGTAPCNNFFGGYSLYSDKTQNIKIGNVGATRKYCPDSENEDKFAGALSTVTSIKIDGENLIMANDTGEIVAVLTAQKQ